ncbi:hypothetical protein MFLAVUS_008819 [Mucor flavus]|uniref:TOG domain-containing protein n=1 Tax=Mucor flavus TaxID=439312 RepID=A0ABP9Z874_9FUNG
MDGQEEDFSSLSIIDRLQHKVWKARVSACEDLTKLLHKTVEDSDFYTYEPFLKKLALEPNAVAQEAGLAAIIEYVSNAPNASSTRETVITALVEKCLGATKAGTKQKATDIILLYAEIDTPEPVLEFVIPGTNAKQPKLVTQTVTVLKELVRQFGVKKVNPKPILKLVPKLFGHADKNVRAEVSALTIELYRWIGQPMMASLSTLKPVQIKELEEAFSKLPAQKPVPERLIRSEQAIEPEEDEPVEEEGEEEQGQDDMDVEDADTFDFADPVDITAKLPSNFYELLASKKWQERREALDALLEQAKTPKIMDKDYSELMGALVKRLNDANMLLVGVTANCIETIATGLRTDFSKYKPMIAPVMTEKLKERKPAILEHLVNGLNAVFASTPMSEMIEDITVASKHKNPQVRSETFKLLSRRLKEVREIPGKAEIKTFAEMFKKLLDDADANAREAGAEGLGTLMKLIGEKPMLAFTDGLDDIKMGKIKEAFEKAVVKAKPAKKAAPPPPVKKAPVAAKKVATKPKPAAAKPTPMAIDDDESDSFGGAATLSPPKRKPPARLSGASSMKKPALSSAKPKPAAPAAGGPKKSAKLPPSSGPEEIKYKFAQEDAEARATEFIPEAIHTDLQQAQWKLRLAAMESLVTHLESEDGNDLEPEIIIRCFSKKPGWKEMNFQVMGKMFYAIQVLSEQCPKFNKACAALCIPVMVEKLGDIKLKKPASECLVAIAEKISLQFVFGQAYSVLKKAKSPKVLADSLLWIHSCLMDFGISGLQIRDLIDLLKFGLTNTNASVRTSAVTVLGALRQYIGPEVKSFVEDVSPALLATIESEFEKVSKMDPPQPTKGNAVAMSGDDGDEDVGANNASADAMESLFPRVDISNQLAKTITECGDANWKIRKQGLDAVMAVIAGANNRIKPSLGADFPGVLKQRLNDSNKNLQSNAVEITGLLALAMGKPFEKYVKPFTGPVMAVLSDNKTTVRQAGVVALENIRKTCSMEMMVSALGTSLANESPALRKELLTWFGTAIKDEPEANKFDFSSVISPMFSCLQDRNPDVRKAAQVCLPELIAVAGYDAVASKTSELKAAQRQAVMPLVEAARGSSGGPSAPPPQQLPRKATETKQRAEIAADDKPPSRMKTLTKKKIGIPTPRSSQAMSAASAATEEAKPPIVTSDPRAKQVRAKKENRWQFDTPRSDVIDGLKSLFDANMSSEVTALLFSNSQYAERDRLNGLGILNECISSPDIAADKYNIDYSDMKARFVANADLILKYLTIRFFDTNTSMLIKCLDITQNLIAIMDEEGCSLSEYEAISFLPFLINKVGDPKEIMRARIRAILKSLCRIYPASKVFNYLLDSAAASKNAKARAECLEEIGALIQRNGISVMLPNKALPLIAVHIGDRDAGVRNAALNGVAQAYILIGDSVMKYMTRLGEKEKGMLEERLKRTKPSASVLAAAEKERAKQEADEMEVDELPSISNLPRLGGRSQIGKPRASIVSPQRTIHHVQPIPEPEPMEDVIDDYGHRLPEPVSHRINNMHNNQPELRQARSLQFGYHQPAQQHHVQQQQQMQPPQMHQQQQFASEEDVVDYLIAQITSGDPQPSIDALKNLDKYLSQNPQAVLPDIERLINAITLQVKLAYSSVDPRQPATTRLCKHLVNALVLLFSNRDLACAVPQDALHHLLQELAHRLLDQKMLSLESGPQLSKALNVAMVKVLENSSRNATFSALLSILGTCSAGLRPGDLTSAKDTKYTELIMKCLWKLAKTIQENLRSNFLSPDELLYEINRFFINTPPSEWKRRANESVPLGEMPLRTVKTLLLELVNGLGDSIFQHLTLIDDPQRSSVYPYLHHMLEACRKKDRQQQQQHIKPQHSPMMPVQPIPQQQQQQMDDTNRYLSHSRNSSLSRPASVSSFKSNNMMRSPSMASYPSADGEQTIAAIDSIPAANQSPRLSSPSLNHSQVQPMQIDEAPQEIINKGPPTLTDYDLNTTLTKIFHKIGTRDQTKQGIIELYQFQKSYPLAEAKVNTYLSQTGNYFQSYIRRGLSNLAAEDSDLHAAQAAAAAAQQQQASAASSMVSQNMDYHTTPIPEQYSIQQDQRTSFDSPQLSRASLHAGDDTTEIKLRLLRLQQKFGYNNKSDIEESASTGPAGFSTSDLASAHISKQESSPTYNSFSPRRQSGVSQDYRESPGESDRQQSVSALKERLAKMKQVINSASSSPNL